MKVLVRSLTIVLFVVAVAAIGSAYWLFFYSRDLPDLASLSRFAPESTAIVVDSCAGASIPVIPSSAIGTNLRTAVRAAEGDDGKLALQISRGMFCGLSMKNLKRELLEYKAALQLRRTFTSDQIVNIYLNRAYYGRNVFGVENASLNYYGKHAVDLNVAEVSLIAGLIKEPLYYSPELHADSAKMRRDDVIDAMLKNGFITPEQAELARNSSLQ